MSIEDDTSSLDEDKQEDDTSTLDDGRHEDDTSSSDGDKHDGDKHDGDDHDGGHDNDDEDDDEDDDKDGDHDGGDEKDDEDDDDDDDDDHDDDEDDDDEDEDEDEDGDPPCFTRGTTLRTKHGAVLVEDLAIGDLLWTETHGYQPIRWICQREVAAKGKFAPIRIRAGALGADRDILVSPAHRMLVQGPDVELLFGEPKALVAAKDLVNDTTILRETGLKTVEYFHILFDQHEVLEAHGTLSESFFPDTATVGDFGAEQRAELFALFPELEFSAHGYKTAYPGLMAHEVILLGRQVF